MKFVFLIYRLPLLDFAHNIVNGGWPKFHQINMGLIHGFQKLLMAAGTKYASLFRHGAALTFYVTTMSTKLPS